MRGGEIETGRQKRRTFASYEDLENGVRELLKDIFWWQGDKHITNYVKFKKLGEDRIRVYLYTQEHYYAIDATTGGYLGCGASARKARAGENWRRGSDLADGSFNKKTWERIKSDIIEYELEQLSTEILSRLELQGIDTGNENAKKAAQQHREHEARANEYENEAESVEE